MASSFVGTLFPNNFTQTKHSAVPLSRGVSTRRRVHLTVAESMTTVIEKLGIKIERNPPESKLSQLGVRKWPKWGCPPSKFPWTYEAKETCYLLEGKVKVFPSGSNESVEIAAGDLVVFPKGMSCTWDVSVGVDKHYKFE
ncbi:uncharacterized protein LOC124823728 [Vigna umbellata]|uniref:(S)-ureidoglycine aminohydrolase cupin domain-containing protein n=2 Tax=Phaseolus angularis TaxID=3914 RepID=A0A8T0KPZ4_PHAAN|nr:uncharacterized protein LOC108325951 [Vigna angularis]XP_047151975.1 uncharacterized protein LOC124823728 [Vigna umbellata]KAG2402117.1 uncharacterized protein HKW66_Vig0233130 [Vigna angularis]